MYEALDNPYLALKEGNVEELTKIKGCGPSVATNGLRNLMIPILNTKLILI